MYREPSFDQLMVGYNTHPLPGETIDETSSRVSRDFSRRMWAWREGETPLQYTQEQLDHIQLLSAIKSKEER